MSLSTPVPDIVDQSTDPLLGTHPSWSRIPLHKVARVQNRFPFPSSAFVSGNPEAGMPLIRIRDVMRHRTDTTFIGAFDPAYVVEPGSLLIGMDGDFNTAMWKGMPALLNQRVCRVTTDEQAYSTKFLSYVLPGYLAAINAATSSITVKHLSSKAVEAIPLPLPPLPEQHRIVAAIETHLTRLDAAVAALERARARLKRYRAAVLKAACEGRLVPTEAHLARTDGRPYEPAPALLARIQEARATAVAAHGRAPARRLPLPDPLPNVRPELPEGWAWSSIGALSRVGTGATPLRTNPAFYADGSIPWVTSGALNAERVSEPSEFVTELALRQTNLTVYPVGTLLVAMYGEGKTRGRCSELAIEATTNQAIAALVFDSTTEALRAYVRLFLQNSYEALRREASGGVQPNLNLSIIRDTTIPLPPLREQERIVAEVERRLSVLDQLDAAVTANLKRADALRQSVLRRAFAGHLVPTGDHTT